MHRFVTEMCTFVHISVTKWCIVGYLSDALWDLWDGSIGAGYLNDNIAMELILDVGHFYVASYSRIKRGRPFTPVAAMPHVTVVMYRNSVETVCTLRLLKFN